MPDNPGNPGGNGGFTAHRLPGHGAAGARPAHQPTPALTDTSSDATSGEDLPTRHAARTVRSYDVRRALTLIAMSTVIPGLGLVFTKARRAGLILLGMFAVAALVLGFMLFKGGVVQGAGRLGTGKGLWFLLLLFIVGGLLWLAGIVLTARETMDLRWPKQTKWLQRGFAFVMCLLVAAPATAATRYVLVTQDTFNTIFNHNNSTAHAPGTGDNPWADTPRVNLLLIGSDAGADRWAVRTDSLMVASINTVTGDTTLISIPRNFEGVPFPEDNPLHKIYPDGFRCAQHACLMDAVWVEAEYNHRDLFPTTDEHPGWTTTKQVVGEITGLPIDYSVVVNLAGFQQLVDAMGGVWMNVPKGGIAIGGKLTSSGYIIPGSITGRIPEGYQKLDGYQALWYSRSRVENGDDDRTRRQRCMVNALIGQASPVTFLTHFVDIMDVAKNNISLDMPQDDLPAFAQLAETMKKGNVRTVNITTKNNAHVDFDHVRELIAEGIAKPHDAKAPTPTTSKSPSSTPSTTTTTTPGTSTSTTAISDTVDNC